MWDTLYGLDRIAMEMKPGWREHSLERAMEHLTTEAPEHWARYYTGTAEKKRVLRHFSYSDRIRYYWPKPQATEAAARLLDELSSAPIPETLVSQFLPRCYAGGSLRARRFRSAIARRSRDQAGPPLYFSATRVPRDHKPRTQRKERLA
jgi:D-tagatose 6-phosphate 4-epimerase